MLHFFSEGRYIRIKEDVLDLVDAKINKGVQYGIVFGAASSGKTTIAKALAKNRGFLLVDWEPTINIIKDKYLNETEKGLDDVPFPRVIQYFKDFFAANKK